MGDAVWSTFCGTAGTYECILTGVVQPLHSCSSVVLMLMLLLQFFSNSHISAPPQVGVWHQLDDLNSPKKEYAISKYLCFTLKYRENKKHMAPLPPSRSRLFRYWIRLACTVLVAMTFLIELGLASIFNNPFSPLSSIFWVCIF